MKLLTAFTEVLITFEKITVNSERFIRILAGLLVLIIILLIIGQFSTQLIGKDGSNT